MKLEFCKQLLYLFEEKDVKKMLSHLYVEEGIQVLSSLPSSVMEIDSKKVLSYVKKKDFTSSF